jgi:hypothetical protein
MGLFDKLLGPPSKDEFAKLLMDSIRNAGETSEIIYDQQGFQLHDGETESRIVFLGNAYQEYCSAPASNREKILKHWARNWFSSQRQMPEEFEDIKHDLLPVVRSRCYFELTRLQLTLQGHEIAAWPHQILGEDFAVGLVYDLPESMQSISQDHLDDWGVTFYEALEVARQNLQELQQAFIGPESGEGLYLSASKDGYDATRLILLDLIRRFQLRGDPIAMVPNRDTLIVAGEDDEDALKGMLALAKAGLQELRPISGIALRLDGEDWMPWLPAPEHSLYEEFRMLQIQAHGGDYGEQKELLDKLHEKNGEDVFVASFSGLQDEGGHVLNYAVWPKGVNALLPHTDVVAIMRNEDEPVIAEFDKVLATVGHLMELLDMYPPRYRVKGFPSDEELAVLADKAE